MLLAVLALREEAGEEDVFSLSIFSQVINSPAQSRLDLSKSVTLKDMQWTESHREKQGQKNDPKT